MDVIFYTVSMLLTLVILLIILWFLGYLSLPILPIPDLVLFMVNGHAVSLWDVLIFLVIIMVIGALPGAFRYIATALLFIWLLVLFGLIPFAGLQSIILIALIVGLIAYLISGPNRTLP